MTQYYHANPDGTIERSDAPPEIKRDEYLQIIEAGFKVYGHSLSWGERNGTLYNATVQVARENRDIIFKFKSLSGGGRPGNLPQEQRIQILGEELNELVDANLEGKIGLILSVYKRNEVSIFIAWRPMSKQTGKYVSKQVNIQMIADAMLCGFNQFKYPGKSGVVCAFRPEFMQYYLLNVDVLSEKTISDYHDVAATAEPGDEDTIEDSADNVITYKTGYQTDYERNRIVFGAPGTGKSYDLKSDSEALLQNTNGSYERVTFHPDYAYSHFVGAYKPVTDNAGEIRYEFVPGPFMRVYVDALKSGRTEDPQPHLLLIEEINRAKVAAVFGDVFQLLDRDDDGVSEYEIHATEDIRKHLAKELGGSPEDFDRIRIPDNMFIWATMNSADQGVFPMDTAFKRRWNFEYLGINQNDDSISGKITLGTGTHALEVDWNQLRKAINDKLTKDYKVNEDKLMGPFFLSKKLIKTNETDDKIANSEKFITAFKSKVIMYLYEDAAKQHKYKLFDGCDNSKYSSVCNAFDKIGIDIFGDGFRELYDQQGV